MAASGGKHSGEKKQTKYRRAILKISGEGFCSPGESGIDIDRIRYIASEIKAVAELGVELAVVVGGGNFIRGTQAASQ